MKKYIGEQIQVVLPDGDFLEKNPKCPLSFTWQDKTHQIKSLLSSWTDFSRKGDMARNMREEHLQRSKAKGSWGVGRFYFKVEVEGGSIYTLYYDRAPGKAADRKGKF